MTSCVAHRIELAAPARSNFGVAWISLTAALAIHIVDEATTDFLSVYNPSVRLIRSYLPFLPLPTFSFSVWLTGLILGVLLLLILSPLAFQGARLIVPAAYFLGMMMMGNGLLHIAASIYMMRLMPGVCSAPLLLASSIYLLISVRNYQRKGA
jgi:hypothetical protein